MAASSSSSVQSQPKNRVFINFRGEQLRNSFVSHLVNALESNGIDVYIDEHETRGNDLTILFHRIEESKIALAIISSQYSESKWCLNELVRINECVESRRLVVIPIFYKVETEDVKNQTGVFGDKFRELAKKYDDEVIDKWIKALKAVSQKFGITIDETRKESEYVIQIVGQVMKQLNDISTNLERIIAVDNPGGGHEETTEQAPDSSPLDLALPDTGPPLFGIETRVKQLQNTLESMLKSACDRTLTIGVVGMPGIGKTTLIDMLYRRFTHKFVCSAYLPDISEMCSRGMIDQSTLMRELLRDDEVDDMSPGFLKAKLLSKRCLVVLDNVNHKKQIEVLLGKGDWIKKGSLIIITTRYRSVIEGKVDDTYEVTRLSQRDSLECFNYHALSDHKCNLNENLIDLCTAFVKYAKGNPLALINKTINDVLQLSYDELSLHQKEVFLVVACFFRSSKEYYVRCLLEESFDDEPIGNVSEIKDLASKYLLNISGGQVEMHDLFYTFCKELGSQDSCRVWNHTGFVGALQKITGADNVRGIFLDVSELKNELHLGRYTFTRMRNLRYLKFFNSRCHRDCEAHCKLNFPDGIELPLDELRYLFWLRFPMKNLPESFNPKNLIDLNLPYSKIEEVWVGVKNTPKLKWVDLSYSSKLCSLSGLLNAESLQILNLEGCTGLEELPEGMKHMKSLVLLNMRGCTSLQVLPRLNLISMKTLILTNCSSLQKFRGMSYNLETLYLDGTAIRKLPANMVKLQRLIVLNLKDCKMLGAVPECLGKLKALQELVLSGCSKIKSFPIPIENMKYLQIVLLDGTSITDMPKILQFNSELRCGGINGMSSLHRLCFSNNDLINNLEIDISRLHHLKFLDLKYCKNLRAIPLLPPNLEILDAHGCEKLKKVASPMAVLKLMEQVQSKFIFTNCNNLEEDAKNSITSYAQRKSQIDAARCYKEGNVSEPILITSFPGREVPSWIKHNTTGPKLNLELPPHWCDNRLSTIVLCAVVMFPCTQDDTNRFSIECTYEFKNEDETCVRFSCNLGGGWIEPRKIDSGHVFIGYTSSSNITKYLERSALHLRDRHKCIPTEASVEFKVRDGAGQIMKCGLTLVYEEPIHVVIEGRCNGTSSRRDLLVGVSIVSFAAWILSLVLRFWWVGVIFLFVYGFARFLH